MSSVSEYRKKLIEQYSGKSSKKKDDEEEKKSNISNTNTSSTETTKPYKKSAYREELLKKYTTDKIKSTDVDKWFDNVSSVFKDMEADNTQDYSGRVKNLLDSSKDVYNYLQNNKDYLEDFDLWDKAFSQNRSALRNVDKWYYDKNYEMSKIDNMSVDEIRAKIEASETVGDVLQNATKALEARKKGTPDKELEKDLDYVVKKYGLNPDTVKESDILRIYTNVGEDLKPIDLDVETPESSIAYYDPDGTAVSWKNLLRIKSTEERMSKMENSPEVKAAYDELVEYRDDIKRLENAQFAISAKAEGIAPDSEYEKDLEYAIEKYGLDPTLDMKQPIYEIYMQLVDGSYSGMEEQKAVLESAGYDWDEFEAYKKYFEDKEREKELQKSYRMVAEDYPVLATVFSIASAPGQIWDYAKDLVYMAQNADAADDSFRGMTNVYDNGATNFVGTVTSSVANKIDKDVTEATGQEWVGWLASSAYSGGTSALQSALTTTICVGLFGAAGSTISLGLQGSQAAASSFSSAIKNGSTNGEALATSIASGVAEGLFEKVSLDHFLKISKGYDVTTLSGLFKSIAKDSKNLVLQGLVESSEEMFTEMANNLADDIINGDHSGYNAAVAQYKSKGYSEEEAKKMATIDYATNVLSAMVGGFIGGVSSGSVAVGTNAIKGTGAYINYQNETVKPHGSALIKQGSKDSLMEFARETAKTDSKLNKYIDKVTKKASAKNVGTLSLKVEQSLSKQNLSDITKHFEGKGIETKDAQKFAGYVNKLLEGETLTQEDKAELRKLKVGEAQIKSALADIVSDPESPINIREADLMLARFGYKGKVTDELTKSSTAKVTETKDAIESGDIAVSENGKAKILSSDETVTIDKNNAIARIETVDGNTIVYYNTDKGEVAASDISYASESDALLYEAFTDLSPSVASSLIRNYANIKNNPVSVDAYVEGMREGILFYGKYGFREVGKDILEGSAFAKLPKQYQSTALNIGREVSKNETKTKQDKINSGTTKANQNGKGRVYFENGAKAGNSSQKRAVSLAKHIASAIGINIAFYDSTISGTVNSDANGWFDRETDTIHLDLQKAVSDKHTIAFTLSHEIVHFIEKWSPEKYKVLADFLMTQHAKHGVKTEVLLQNKMAALGTTDVDLAYREMVADAMESMLLDSNATVKLMELRQKDAGLFNKLKAHILELINKIRNEYKNRGYEPTSEEGKAVRAMEDSLTQFHKLFEEALVGATESYQSAQTVQSIGSHSVESLSEAKDTDGKPLFQYKAMESDKETYRKMLTKWGGMTDVQVNNLFTTIDTAMDIIKDNLEVLDYAWERDIDDRAFSPVKPNSDSLYKVSLDFSTLCRKRLLQQTVQAHLQEALDKTLSREEGIAIRDALIALQEEGRKIEVACALCYVEAARMKSPAQIEKFIKNREKILKDYFATKNGGSIKDKIKQAEADARARLGVGDKSLKSLPGKVANEIRDAKKAAKESYIPTATEQKTIDMAIGMTVNDFTTPEGLESLAKNNRDLFDAYTSYVRNATKSKGIESDTWWRAGDSLKVGDVLIANMNRENGLRSQSWSDFQVIHILDYIASTIEFATRNAKEQAYSKVPDYVELMGNTGVMINMSLIPTAKFNGKLEYDSVEGIDYKRALELRDKYHATAGTICIGIDNVQIKLLLGDTTVDYVIPYHRSGMAAHIRKAMHIPTWSEYELYQSESNLSGAEAKANAKKYGVELLSESDPNWHKHTSFSEWFDIKEAQQIAKIENANPSDPAKQKEYGVMYGGYMAMQNAANNYLKLCAERGLAPKFSHEKADFTSEANYWKLLIDRKMVDNITGEVIEQQSIKPIFDSAEITRILNDELERYPGVKEDQDYAIRKVTEEFLAGNIKGGMSADAIAKVMQTPVDNITTTNIIQSANDVDRVQKQAKQRDIATVDLTGDTELSKLVDGVHGASRYKTIANYIMDVLGNKPITLSDGTVAVVDKRDALHIANKSGAEKTAQIAKIREIVEKARLCAYDPHVEHNKFSQFLYYEIAVKYRNEEYPLYINVGLTLNDKTYHIYDITKKIRDTANRINGLERPSTEEGYALESDISKIRIPHSDNSVKEQFQKKIDAEYLDAVNRGDMEAAQRMVDEAARDAGYETDAYHGTNQGEFNVFEWNKTQRADGGFFGRGHYFTKSENMAKLYGNRIVKAKLKLGKTFVWSEEVNSYQGKKPPELLSRNIVSLINMSKIFPDIFANRTMSYWEYDAQSGENIEKTIKWGELERIVNDLAKELTLREYADGTYRWHTEGRFWEVPVGEKYPSAEQANEGKFFAAINALKEKYEGLLSAMTFDDQTTYTQQYGTEITEALKNRGYASAMDTPEGGEIVIFDSSQIKSADPVTYDDNGDVIPLSERFNSKNSDIRFQKKTTSNRELLSNALEDTVQNHIEKNKLAEYKKKIDLINAEEQKLHDLRGQIKELSFAKGTRDTKRIKELQFEANMAANRINTYDRQLLNLESTKALKNVLEREKKLAYQKAEKQGKEALAAYKEKSAATVRELLERNQEERKKSFERRKASEMRDKIKNFKAKLERSLLNPTDRVYVPINLANAMIGVCDLIDTDTPLYKVDGTINKAQERRNLTKDRLQALKDEYEALKDNADPTYSGEFDEIIYKYLTKLRNEFGEKSLSDMTYEELSEMYDVLKSIEGTLQDARKLIGRSDAQTIYEAADSIISEQAKITKKRKNGKRNVAQRAKDNVIDLSLSPVRNVERMSGYNQNSELVKLFNDFEKGVRQKNFFAMNAYKAFEELTTGDNSKAYDDAIYKEYGDKKYTDVNGRKFGVSKMQMMQTILSYEREVANNMHHIEGSGFAFADMDMLRKGKLKEAVSEEYSHRLPAAVALVEEFKSALENDKWSQDYMETARKFFNGTAKDAINETYLTLKHRIIARDKSYIPFEVDRNFVVREISAQNDIQQTINSYGMLQETKKGASQPLIITGLNNILDRHIDQVGNVYGLAVPVRNFNKVWNVRSVASDFGDPSVQAAIQRNWGLGGTKHITQTVQDLQGSRPNTQYNWYRKIKSGYIGATFLLNLSVVTKQIGSLYAATSMLKWRGGFRMFANLVGTMANSKKISAEVDKYTATAWMRRQGLSDAELYTLLTESKKPGLQKFFSKFPTVINPAKWITAMDSTVALSLWKYAKQDTAKRTGLKGEELLRATAEFYDSVIENTQSMTDVLHRPEIQKKNDVVSEAFGMFKTDLYQMAGQLQVSLGRFNANKSAENGKVLGRTVYAILRSAIWGSLMTSLFALLRYKVNPYRDEDDKDLTIWSWLKRSLFGLGGDVVGYFLPLVGSEIVGVFENIMYGESEDIVDSLALTAINDLYDAMITAGSAIKEGEKPSAEQYEKLVVKALQAFGVPSNNIKRIVTAIKLHAKDIANGQFLSYEAGAERTAANYMHGIVDEIVAGNTDEAEKRFDKAAEDKGESKLKSALGSMYKTGEVDADTTKDILSEYFGLDDDEIYWQFDSWDYAKENDTSDGYAKYDDFYSAVESGKNLKAVIKQYTDNGVEKKTLSSQITKYFKPLYIEMSKSERANLKGYLLNAYVQLGYDRKEKSKDIDKWLEN